MILRAADSAIKKKAPRAPGKHQHTAAWWNDECDKATAVKRKALRTFQCDASEKKTDKYSKRQPRTASKPWKKPARNTGNISARAKSENHETVENSGEKCTNLGDVLVGRNALYS